MMIETSLKKQHEETLKKNPNDADAWHALGILAAQDHDHDSALTSVNKAILLKPDQAHFYNSLGNILLRLKQFDKATQAFQTAIQIDNHYATAYNNLGNVYYQTNQWMLAKNAYEKAIVLKKEYVDARKNLEMVLKKMGAIYFDNRNFKKAIQLFEQALVLNNPESNLHHLLANGYLELGNATKALQHYFQQLEKMPLPETYYNIGVILMGQDKLIDALLYLEKVSELDVYNIDSLLNCGSIYLKQNKIDRAIVCYEKANRLKPNDTEIEYILSALTQKQIPQKAPTAYLERLFDHYAPHYDQHLTTVLHYEVPKQLYRKIQENCVVAQHSLRIVDLGCGTGLTGVVFKSLAKELIGIDISGKMIEQARLKNSYDQLILGDIESKLSTFSKVDLILAADVLTYIGDLGPIFSRAFYALSPAGLFALSVEETHEKDFILQSSMRYAHSRSYLKTLIQQCGFAIQSFDNAILRKQRGKPVMGYFIVLKK